MDLILWALIVGIVMMIAATVLLVILILNSKIAILSKLMLLGFIIVLFIGGFASIGAFIVIALIRGLLGIADEILFLYSNIATLIGTIIGVGVAIKVQNIKKRKCEADPNCSLI